MRTLLPSSRGGFRVRLSAFDTLWAAATPLLALDIRDASILSTEHLTGATLYWGASFVFALVAFLVFRLNDGISRYFSVDDAINVMKAACGANLMSALVLFSFTRLDGIPRSTPIIQILILSVGLLTVRGLHRWRDTNGKIAVREGDTEPEQILMIGVNRLTALYINFLQACCPNQYRIIGILDNEAPLTGHTMLGIPVVAATPNIEGVIREFELHGVSTDRILVAGDKQSLPVSYLEELGRLCSRREIMLQFIPELIGLDRLQAVRRKPQPKSAVPNVHFVNLPAYHNTKRIIDFVASSGAILILAPLFIVAAFLVVVDVGAPVLFWQQRLGRGGHNLLLYKFRTFRPPFDSNGATIPENERLSWIGHLLRRTRLDELPQLFSVLVGDMSLVGPRPLLPHDQPADASVRLSVRPGITGWAQANGGNLVTAEEKGALDAWYVRNASLRLDLRIIGMTIRFFLTGERRSEQALQEALGATDAGPRLTRAQQTRSFLHQAMGTLLDQPAAVTVGAEPAGTSDTISNGRSDRSDHI